MCYNLGYKVWKRNRVLSSALQGVAAKLSPKFAGPYTIAAQLGPNVTSSEENSEGEQAEASPSEISEERNALLTSHSTNAEVPEIEVHARPRCRPRNAGLVVIIYFEYNKPRQRSLNSFYS